MKKFKLNYKLSLGEKFFLSIFFISFFYFIEKTDFIKDALYLYKTNEAKRIENLYGYCSGESIGYLKFAKQKIKFESNPTIVNFKHTPPNQWAIYNSNLGNSKNNYIILLNYPGKEINLEIKRNYKDLFEITDIYFFSTIAEKIKFLSLDNKNINNLKIEFYKLDKHNNLTRIKDLQLTKYSYENKFSVNEFLSEFDIIESRLFIKLNKSDLSKLDIIFQNKYLLDQYEILDKHKNCYVLKND
tara:strand:+ start:106 stop:834 length:729 start_codon:yes stop_codon:yes gene_type:complete